MTQICACFTVPPGTLDNSPAIDALVSTQAPRSGNVTLGRSFKDGNLGRYWLFRRVATIEWLNRR
jgi:hypothetical protein